MNAFLLLVFIFMFARTLPYGPASVSTSVLVTFNCVKWIHRHPAGSVCRSVTNFPQPILQTLVIYTSSIYRGKMTSLTCELTILTLAFLLPADVSACWVMMTAKLMSYTSGTMCYNIQEFVSHLMTGTVCIEQCWCAHQKYHDRTEHLRLQSKPAILFIWSPLL